VFYEFTPSVEAVGIDEAFLDLSGLEKLFGPPEEICFKIKARIKELTGLTASVGLAPNKMTAKIASDLQKPDGFVHVTPENLREFLFPLDIGKIWGMGEHSKQILNRAGIFTVGQLAAKKPSTLERLLGKNGLYRLELANGIDPRPVQAYEGVKSVSNEHTFTEDTSDTDKIRATLSFLAERVSARMRRKQLKGVTVGLKIRFDDFTTLTRARTIETPTNFPETILAEITKLFSQFVPLPRPVRLVGVRVANFRGEGKQLPLFEDADAAKKEKVYKAVDEIRKKYGFGSMGRASSSKDSDTE
ncbi:MAG: DNA polymerase IV, partial [Elusimicrobiaceae bacterium]